MAIGTSIDVGKSSLVRAKVARDLVNEVATVLMVCVVSKTKYANVRISKKEARYILSKFEPDELVYVQQVKKLGQPAIILGPTLGN